MPAQTQFHFSTVTLIGDRIKLIPVSDDHANFIFQEFTEEITRLMIPSPPSDIDQVHDFIRYCRQNIQNNTELTLVILNKQTDEFLGVCALHRKRNPHQPELGIWLKKTAHGKRLGREAIALLVDWARNNLDFEYLVYPCDENNIPSRKIAESLGGKIYRTDKVISMSGRILNEVAYRISG